MLVALVLTETTLKKCFRKMLKVGHRCFNFLETTGNTLTSLQLFLNVFAFFLKIGAIDGNFKQ